MRIWYSLNLENHERIIKNWMIARERCIFVTEYTSTRLPWLWSCIYNDVPWFRFYHWIRFPSLFGSSVLDSRFIPTNSKLRVKYATRTLWFMRDFAKNERKRKSETSMQRNVDKRLESCLETDTKASVLFGSSLICRCTGTIYRRSHFS